MHGLQRASGVGDEVRPPTNQLATACRFHQQVVMDRSGMRPPPVRSGVLEERTYAVDSRETLAATRLPAPRPYPSDPFILWSHTMTRHAACSCGQLHLTIEGEPQMHLCKGGKARSFFEREGGATGFGYAINSAGGIAPLEAEPKERPNRNAQTGVRSGSPQTFRPRLRVPLWCTFERLIEAACQCRGA